MLTFVKPKFVRSCHRCITERYLERRGKEMRLNWLTVLLLILASGLLLSASQSDCSFLKNPDEFLVDTARVQKMRSDLTVQVASFAASALPRADAATVDSTTIQHKNFIDDYIFNRMA